MCTTLWLSGLSLSNSTLCIFFIRLHVPCLKPFELLQQNTINWVAYKNKIISHCSRAWEAQNQVLSDDSVSGESPLSGSQMAIFLLCPYKAERERESSGVSYKDTNPTHEDSAFMT